MKSEKQLREKLKEMEDELSKVESKEWVFIDGHALRSEFLKKNIAFIKWCLDEPYN